ncbi:hypothetical protein G6O67_005275 [Ophiocordyceps sinensis]|uniref:Rhodopsin domain-containing protein n=2 Tax=Ophiocordyceps sinensis TaxID=72228 RepID=A0A8H4PRD0_9HYPO|nr:triacylglycerol lipase-like protein [Ophiocordyceps sinensis CO18]KAF4508957.1 hypothetical protein G6O67_005275 [Ophiocordyceps sinensis]
MADAPDAEAAAAAAAFVKFTTEAWTLLAIGVLITSLRTYARARAVGFKGLQADDYLVWVAAFLYVAETILAFCVGHVAHGLANNGMTDEQRVALSPNDPEYRLRVIGSKIQLAGWSTYSTLLWSLKASLLVFYLRLTAGLHKHYLIRIYIGFFLVAGSWIVVVTNLFLACRPFRNYWQINPDPGNVCHPAISNQLIWVYLSFNVFTDLYLISIPLPMLWKANLRPLRKLGLMILLSGGLFVVVCAILRSILIVTDATNGAQLAGSWAVRETFLAVVTTNLPMIFPLLKTWFSLTLGTISSRRSTEKAERTPGHFRTFGGGGGNGPSWRGRGPPSANPITDFTFNESEERMMDDVRMQDIKVWGEPASNATEPDQGAICKRVDVSVTHQAQG